MYYNTFIILSWIYYAMAKEKLEKRENPAKKLESETTKKELVDNLKEEKKWFWSRLKDKFSWKSEKAPEKKLVITEETIKHVLFSWQWSNFVHDLDNYELQGVTRNDIVNMCIDANRCYLVYDHLDKFPELDHMDFAKRMIDIGEGSSLTFIYERLENMNNQEIADYLIEHWAGYCLAREYHKFKGLDNKEIVNKLLDHNDYEAVVDFLRTFEWIDHQEVVDKITEMWNWYYVADYLEKFGDIDTQKLADALIQQGKCYPIAKNIMKFGDLNQETYDILIKEGYANEVMRKVGRK